MCFFLQKPSKDLLSGWVHTKNLGYGSVGFEVIWCFWLEIGMSLKDHLFFNNFLWCCWMHVQHPLKASCSKAGVNWFLNVLTTVKDPCAFNMGSKSAHRRSWVKYLASLGRAWFLMKAYGVWMAPVGCFYWLDVRYCLCSLLWAVLKVHFLKMSHFGFKREQQD